jgi:hypothetical protein
MSQVLPNLNLPLLQASQAQKHITHNEALNILDAIVQLSILSSILLTPPVAVVGDRYLIPAGATDAWVDKDGAVAIFDGNVWLFVMPKHGWLAFDQSKGNYLHFDGIAWADLPKETTLANMQSVGINATADATNRLIVNADAALFSHEGAGHQIKVNKASAADTASLLFQSNWAGHAEMGLNGSNHWSLKISPDGAAWQEAISIDPASGAVSGVSVQSDPNDTTAGRLMRADYGYGPGNLVGPVAQIGGIPTGAVIESGSTVDGWYTRFADGLQVCSVAGIGVDVNVSVGALFKSPVQTWTYPMAFVANPVVSGGDVSDVENMWVSAGQAGLTGCSSVAFAHTSTTGASYSLTAIGRWF